MKHIGVFAVVCALMLGACASDPDDSSGKFTASLRKALSLRKDSTAAVRVVAVASRAIDSTMRGEALRHTVDVEPVGEHLLKASVLPGQLRSLSEIEWLERIDIDPEYKFDSMLRAKTGALRRDVSDAPLLVSGKCAKSISAEQRDELTASGARIVSTAGDTFTAEVTFRSLYRLAALDAVTFLQLSGDAQR